MDSPINTREFTMNAREAYEDRKSEVLIRIDQIKAAVANRKPEAIHWGHAGDMNHVLHQLEQIAEFLQIKQ